jgi:hypothetical protein
MNSYGRLFGKSGGSDDVLASQSALGCNPDYGTDQPSYVILSPLEGPVLNIFTLPYTVVPFHSDVTTVRRMTIALGGVIYTIKQMSW